MDKPQNKLLFLFILLILSVVSRFMFFGFPNKVVFDEVYFGKYASNYLTGNYYFDPHPPLGKMLISGMGLTAGIKLDETNYSAIGNSYNNRIYIWYRLLPMIAGSLLPLVIFLFAIALGLSSPVALAIGVLVIFENSQVVLSRFISLDSLLYLFGFLSLWLYLLYRNSQGKKTIFILLSAVTSTLAFSVKWTGLSFVAIILLTELFDLINSKKTWFTLKIFFIKIFLFSSIGLTIYFSIFALHFYLLPNTGEGDIFMSQSFQKTLNGNRLAKDSEIKTPDTWNKFLELNKEMYLVNTRMTAGHPYSSKWYSWPFMTRPIFYWQSDITNDNQNAKSYIYFLGNPAVYWLSSLAIIVLALCFLISIFRKLKKKITGYSRINENNEHFATIFVLSNFLINFLPFIFIGRVMFLYHYGIALIFAIIALALIIDKIQHDSLKQIILAVILTVNIVCFVFFAPITYGIPLSDQSMTHKMWFKTWR